MKVSKATMKARWVESEVLHLKRMGLSFLAISDQITQIGRGQTPPITPIPDGLSFPSGYQISRQACCKALHKAIAREPALGVEELRKIDHARTEELWMHLQPGIRKGDNRAIENGVKVLDHSAKINGYAAPSKHALTGRDGNPLDVGGDLQIPIAALHEALRLADLDDEAVVTDARQADPPLTTPPAAASVSPDEVDKIDSALSLDLTTDMDLLDEIRAELDECDAADLAARRRDS